MTKLIGLVGLAAVMAGCSSAAAIEKTPRPVRVAAAEESQAPRGARYTAEIAPNEQLVLAFKNSGYVESLLQTRDATGRVRDVEEGDRITKGTVLARIQASDYQAQVARASASLQQADVSVVKARADFERAQALFQVEALTQPDLDAARAAHDSALAGSAGAQAQLRLADLALSDVSLRTPHTAVVLERRVERGSLVTAGTPGFVLGTVNPVKAIFGVPDQTVQRMKLGSPLTLTTDAVTGRPFTGRITNVSPAADSQTRLFMVEVSIPNGDASLRPGMVATVELDAPAEPTRSTAPLVPLTAVVKQDGGEASYGVYMFERDPSGGSRARFRAVTLGSLVGNAIQVTNGIQVGDTVIVSAPTLLEDGEAVTLIP